VTLIPAFVDGRLEPIEKMAVHRAGLRHLAVSVFVARGDEVLLQKRAAGKYHTPGLWTNACCTHPEWGERPRDCAVRRLFEELGATGLDPTPRGRVEYRAEVGSGLVEHEVVDLFVAEAPDNFAPAPNPLEVESIRWMSLCALRQDVDRRPEEYTPWLRIYLRRHAVTIFGTLA
jgi:isopentenyl-diphosphate delta-isomerase